MRTSGLKGRAQRGSPAPVGPVHKTPRRCCPGAAWQGALRPRSPQHCQHLGLPKEHVCCYVLYPEEDTQAAVRTAQAAVPSVPRGLQFQLLSEDTGVHFSAL